MAVIYRDKRGVEYESVPLPSHEVTDAVSLDARIVSRRSLRKVVSIYEGADGAELAKQPRSQRRNWTDEQWGAYEEQSRIDAEKLRNDMPVASAVVVKSSKRPDVD